MSGTVDGADREADAPHRRRENADDEGREKCQRRGGEHRSLG
jgi:hypothetical protein